jgi:hypothetical protein
MSINPENLISKSMEEFLEEHHIEEVAKLHYYHYKAKRISKLLFEFQKI